MTAPGDEGDESGWRTVAQRPWDYVIECRDPWHDLEPGARRKYRAVLLEGTSAIYHVTVALSEDEAAELERDPAAADGLVAELRRRRLADRSS